MEGGWGGLWLEEGGLWMGLGRCVGWGGWLGAGVLWLEWHSGMSVGAVVGGGCGVVGMGGAAGSP